MEFITSLIDFTGGVSMSAAKKATKMARYRLNIKNPLRTKILNATFDEIQIGSALILFPMNSLRTKFVAVLDLEANFRKKDVSVVRASISMAI